MIRPDHITALQKWFDTNNSREVWSVEVVTDNGVERATIKHCDDTSSDNDSLVTTLDLNGQHYVVRDEVPWF